MYTVISGTSKTDRKPVIINDGFTNWQLVAVDGHTAILEAQEYREIGYEPRIRRMATSDLRVILGWDTQANIAIANDMGIVVINDDIANGFMIAEPIWAKPDEKAIRADMARMREEVSMARDCDRAASFGMW